MGKHGFSLSSVSLALLMVVFFAACTPHKETVNKYKYLVKENENVAVKETPVKVDTKEKIAEPAIGEKLMPVLEEAAAYLGTPYRHGGSTKQGIDCSGLTMNCYSKAGLKLPRSAAEQSQYGQHIERNELKIGEQGRRRQGHFHPCVHKQRGTVRLPQRGLLGRQVSGGAAGAA
jgi:cell wall-associated NlpC family hydrolase